MEQQKIDELLTILGSALKDLGRGGNAETQTFQVYQWMKDNAPKYLE